ncbi:MAG: bifunctional adenosylcobinamide kinase/adenosylcobinamide-phosphate guanylyltransferase [Actinomycetota bacterium]
MADRFILLVGGARSGKSDFAVEFAARLGGPTTFLATAEAGDDDMALRIRRHQYDRPAEWGLVEEPLEVIDAVRTIDSDRHLILDCLTLWVSNLMLADRADIAITEAAFDLARVLRSRSGTTLVVSNEVGLGVHPGTSMGGRYRDLLGRVNRAIADRADRSLFFACGQAIELTDPYRLIDADIDPHPPGAERR